MPDRTQAINFYNQALALAQQDQRTAYQLLSSAVAVDPTFGQGWVLLGCTNADLKLWWGSIAAFRRAVELPDGEQPGDMTPKLRLLAYENLGHRLYHMAHGEEGWRANEKALALDAASAYANLNKSMLLSTWGDHEGAVQAAERALSASQEPMVQTGAAFAFLFAGRYAEGLRWFEGRFPYKLPEYQNWPYPRWDGKLVGRLLLTSEQGLGDAVSYARFIPWAAGIAEHVTVRVQPELVKLFREILPISVAVEPASVTFPPADAWDSLVSLPHTMGLKDAEIAEWPGLHYPQFDVPTGWKVSDRFNVGIAWAGAANNDIDRYRSLPFEDFLELGKVPGIHLYSLQVGERVADLHHAGCAGSVKDLSPLIRDAADTAGLIQQLDLVVCCDSFVGHLAGAVGTEAWLLMHPFGRDYRSWRPDSKAHPLWCPKTRVFRRGFQDESWSEVWRRVRFALMEKTYAVEAW